MNEKKQRERSRTRTLIYLLSIPKRIWLATIVPFALLVIGTIGYKILGGSQWSWFDSLYMTAITLTTVGYLEVHDMTEHPELRLFTICLLFGGVFTLFYSATETIKSIVSGEFAEVYGKQRMHQTLADLNDHVIVCGMGRMGRLICHEFDKQGLSFVVIDRNTNHLKYLAADHGIALPGDATSDDILVLAGVERARALIAVLPSDADNLYVTLSARVLNDRLFIIARAEEEAAEAKLKRVGANQVVAPYVIGGHRVAQAVLRPTVGHFLERALRPGEEDYQMEEMLVEAGSSLAEKKLAESGLQEELGIVVLTIRRTNGDIIYNPRGDVRIEPGNVILVIGHRRQLNQLELRVRKR